MSIQKFLLFLVLFLWNIVPSISQRTFEGEAHDRWIVKLNDISKRNELGDWLKQNADKTEVIFKDLSLYSLEVDSPVMKTDLLKQLKKRNINANIYPDLSIEWRLTPNDPDYVSQWALDQINMPRVWDITTGRKAPNGDDIVVAIFDDGFDVNHPEYKSNIWTNNNEIPSNGIDDDGNGYVDDFLGWNATTNNDIHRLRTHGTAVAGIIGAIGNNGSQIAGVNWNVKLMLTSGGRNDNFSISDIVKAYQYVYTQRQLYNNTQGQKGAYVVVTNYSGGAPNLFPKDFPSWCEIYDLLGQEGVLNFTSAPNSSVDVDVVGDLPSTCPSDYLIIVTNTDRTDQKAQNAGFGSQSVDIGAPGERIVTTGLNGEINTDFSGASASAPFVAGVASLLYSVACEEAFENSFDNPSALALAVRDALLSRVKSVTSLEGITTSGGRLDADASLTAFRGIKGVGDCCQISISDLNVIDESCMQAGDGSIAIKVDTTDTRGSLNYEITTSKAIETNLTGEFNFLDPDIYNISITAQRDEDCRVDSIAMIEESMELCPYGEFKIVSIWPNPTSDMLNISFDLDELKHFEFLIYNSLGQQVYRQLTMPNIGNRNEQINISFLPEGVYFIAMRGNDLWNTASFMMVRE